MPNTKKKTDSVAKLKKELADAKAQNSLLKKQIKKTKPKSEKNKYRRLGIGASAVIATLVLVFGNIFFWAGRTLVDTNKYVATVGPLIKQPPIQTAIAEYTTQQLFAHVDVQSYISNALPPKAAFLAPELTSQVRTYTQTAVKKTLNNSKVQSYWYDSLTKSHTALVTFSKNYTGNGDIYVSNLYPQISERLAGTKLSFLSGKTLPSSIGSIKIGTAYWLVPFHKLVVHLDLWRFLSYVVFIISTSAAIILARRKLRMLAKLFFVYAFFMLITLIAIKIMGQIFVSDVNQMYHAAAQSAYNVITSSFVDQTVTILIISVIVSIAALLADHFKLSAKLKPTYNQLKAKTVSTGKKASK